MAVVTGKVESKSRSGEGIKINGTWYNGSKSTLASVNWKDEVTINVDDKNTVISVEDLAEAAPAKKAPKKSSGGWDDPNRQAAIIFQSSRKDAIEVANSLLSAGILPLPSKANEKYDAFCAFVEEKTQEFYNAAIQVQETGELPQ